MNDRIFVRCNLTSITFEGTLNWLEIELFRECSKLGSIRLPQGLTSIGTQCFVGCSSLKYVWIPKSVTQILEGAFSGVNKECNLDFESGSTFIKDNDLLYSSEYKSLLKRLYFQTVSNTSRCSHSRDARA